MLCCTLPSTSCMPGEQGPNAKGKVVRSISEKLLQLQMSSSYHHVPTNHPRLNGARKQKI